MASSLEREPPSRDLTHEQVVDLFCTQVSDAYERARRFARR
jgi:hypothetical protein